MVNELNNGDRPLSGEAEALSDLREAFHLLWAARWRLLIILGGAIACGLLYLLSASPTFEADGLVQVEDAKSVANLGVSPDLSALLGKPMKAVAEIQVLRSRMILDKVIDALNLDIAVSPRFFPFIGRLASRRSQGRTLSDPWLGLTSFAWGGEILDVAEFDVPDRELDRRFRIRVVTPSTYSLIAPEGREIGHGVVGVRAPIASEDGQISVLVRNMRARPGEEFRVSRLSHQRALDQLRGRLTVGEQGRGSDVIRIACNGHSPNEVANVVNAIEDAYVSQNIDRRSAEAQQSLDYLQEQLPRLREKVEASQNALDNYQTTHGSIDVSKETQLLLQRGVELEGQRVELSQRRDQALQRFTPEHPLVRSIDTQLAGIADEERKLRLRAELLPQAQQEVLRLDQELEINMDLYTSLVDSSQQLRIAKAGSVGTVRVVDRAFVPSRPIAPRPVFVLFLSTVAGLMGGCLTIYLLRAVLVGLDGPLEIERATGLVTYGSIPFSPAQKKLARHLVGRARGSNGALLATSAPQDPAVEGLRSLRTSLQFARTSSAKNVLMLTGPGAGLGKSFVAANLGALLAMADEKVIVIDADLRRGHLSRYFGADTAKGLSDFLAGLATEDEILRHSHVAGLDFVSAGTRPHNPAELLMRPSLSQFLNKLRQNYSLVILDTPPVPAVADSTIIGPEVGITLLVLKAAEHSSRVLVECIRALNRGGVKVDGAVLNQVGVKLGAYGYGTYGSRAQYR